jgi:hypothetical protein
MARKVPKGRRGNYVGFKRLSGKIQKSGKSKKSADAIAASIGRKKYGAKAMGRFSAQGRKAKRGKK